jgi:hypothetical protein
LARRAIARCCVPLLLLTAFAAAQSAEQRTALALDNLR